MEFLKQLETLFELVFAVFSDIALRYLFFEVYSTNNVDNDECMLSQVKMFEEANFFFIFR
jgi:hypothetical protein